MRADNSQQLIVVSECVDPLRRKDQVIEVFKVLRSEKLDRLDVYDRFIAIWKKILVEQFVDYQVKGRRIEWRHLIHLVIIEIPVFLIYNLYHDQ